MHFICDLAFNKTSLTVPMDILVRFRAKLDAFNFNTISVINSKLLMIKARL